MRPAVAILCPSSDSLHTSPGQLVALEKMAIAVATEGLTWYIEQCPLPDECSKAAWARAAVKSTESEEACREKLYDHLCNSRLHWDDDSTKSEDDINALVAGAIVKTYRNVLSKRQRTGPPPTSSSSSVYPSAIARSQHESSVVLTATQAKAMRDTIVRSEKAMLHAESFFQSGLTAFREERDRLKECVASFDDLVRVAGRQ